MGRKQKISSLRCLVTRRNEKGASDVEEAPEVNLSAAYALRDDKAVQRYMVD